ncbi:MAG TPA: DUF2203 family protein [Acidimicrobiales bacterium]|nr:DUF2203 family protein [Acidimicrobiales bacterium]
MRYWTEEEARSYLPRLRLLLAAVQEAARRASAARSNGHGSRQRPAGPAPVSLEEALGELSRNSIVLRDPLSGLVDFPARGQDGVEYLLCWRVDEQDLGFWHLPEEGFAGRKPLPRNPGS